MNLLDQFIRAGELDVQIPSEEMTGCCLTAWQKLALAGRLAGVDSWQCPKCGSEWRPRKVGGGMRVWAYRSNIEVFRQYKREVMK